MAARTGLIGDRGILEIKDAEPHVLIGLIERDAFPAEHKAQCQGNLLVAERELVDLAVGSSPRLPLFRKRARRDEAYIRDLASAIAQFNEELEALVERVRSYEATPTLREALQQSVAGEAA